jgi:hypothetical protein
MQPSVALLLLLLAHTSAATVTPPAFVFESLRPTTDPPVEVGATHSRTVDVPLRACGHLNLTKSQFEVALTARELDYTNAGVELGLYAPDILWVADGYDLNVHRPALSFRKVATGTLTTDLTGEVLNANEQNRFHLSEADLMAAKITFPVGTNSTVICREFTATVTIQLLQPGAFSFDICATWAQPLWSTQCISIPALQLHGTGGMQPISLPWHSLARSYPLPTAPLAVWLDRTAASAGLPGTAIAPGAVVLRAQYTVTTVEHATARFMNLTGRVNITSTVTVQRTSTARLERTVSFLCIPAGSLDVTALRAVTTAIHVFRHHCTADYHFAQDLVPPENSSAHAISLFTTPAPARLTDGSITFSQRTINTALASFQVCAIDGGGVLTCASPSPFALHNTSHPGHATPDDGPTFHQRQLDSRVAATEGRVDNEPPLMYLASSRKRAQGQPYMSGAQGLDDDHPTLGVYDAADNLLAYCASSVDVDPIETRSARRAVYLVSIGREVHGNFTRFCAELNLNTVWNTDLTLKEERMESHDMGAWPQTPSLTSTVRVQPDTSQSREFRSVTRCEPRFVNAREPVAVQCTAALPALTWNFTEAGLPKSRTVTRAHTANIVQTRSQQLVAPLAIRDVLEVDTGDGTALVHFTITVPALGETATLHDRCVIPVVVSGTPGYVDSPNSTVTDSLAVCADMQVVFSYAVNETERIMDQVRVGLPQFTKLERGVGSHHSGVHVFVPPRDESASRRRLLASLPLVFGTTFQTVQLDAFNRAAAILAKDVDATLQCAAPSAPIPVTYTHELVRTGTNSVVISVAREALPDHGTLSCTLTVPRLGFTSMRTLVPTGIYQFPFFAPGPGAKFTATTNATSVLISITFLASGLPPVANVTIPITQKKRVENIASWATGAVFSLLALSLVLGFGGVLLVSLSVMRD